jgi:hypothetical protein
MADQRVDPTEKKRSPMAFARSERRQRGRNDSFYYRSIKVMCPKSRLV